MLSALELVPFFVVYKLSPLTYYLGRLLVRHVSNFAMVNLIAGRKVVEELLQDEVSEWRLAQELERILGDPLYATRLRKNLEIVRERLQLGLTQDGEQLLSAQRGARAVKAVLCGEEDEKRGFSRRVRRRHGS